MPRYYQYGYQGPAYAYNWDGVAPAQSQAAELVALGDVERSQFFTIPKEDDPYYLHKAQERLPYFTVPPGASPYYLHKYGKPKARGVGSRWGGQGGGGPRGGLGDVEITRWIGMAALGAILYMLWVDRPKLPGRARRRMRRNPSKGYFVRDGKVRKRVGRGRGRRSLAYRPLRAREMTIGTTRYRVSLSGSATPVRRSRGR